MCMMIRSSDQSDVSQGQLGSFAVFPPLPPALLLSKTEGLGRYDNLWFEVHLVTVCLREVPVRSRECQCLSFQSWKKDGAGPGRGQLFSPFSRVSCRLTKVMSMLFPSGVPWDGFFEVVQVQRRLPCLLV